jgi:hypothetical protein
MHVKYLPEQPNEIPQWNRDKIPECDIFQFILVAEGKFQIKTNHK